MDNNIFNNCSVASHREPDMYITCFIAMLLQWKRKGIVFT